MRLLAVACAAACAATAAAAACSCAPGGSAHSDADVTAAILRHGAAAYDACRDTARCPRAERQHALLDGAVAQRSRAFAGGSLEPADAWFDAEDWVAGSLGLAAPPAAVTAAAASSSPPLPPPSPSPPGAAVGVDHAAAVTSGLTTWELGDASLAPWQLHTPNFGLDAASGAPCEPPVAPSPGEPAVPNPYSYARATVNGSAFAHHARDADAAGASACQSCLVDIDTDALTLLVACPPGFSAASGTDSAQGGGEVSPPVLGTRGRPANLSSGVDGFWAALGPLPVGAVASGHRVVPPGWPAAVFTGVRIVSRRGLGVPVAVFHTRSLHLGRGTVVTLRGAYPLALVSRASVVINTPLVAEPGSLGGFPPQLLPSAAHRLLAGPGCEHPTRDLLFTLLVTTAVAPAVQQVTTSVADGQTLRGGWAASLCVCSSRSGVVHPCAGAAQLAACVAAPHQQDADASLELASGGAAGASAACACAPGYRALTTRRISPAAEPEDVRSALDEDLGLAALAAAHSADAPTSRAGAVAGLHAVTVTRDSQRVRGGFSYSVTFSGWAGRVPLLSVTSHLSGVGAAVTVLEVSPGSQVEGNYSLSWRGGTTPPLPVGADAGSLEATLHTAFGLRGLVGVTVSAVQVSSTGDVCRWLDSQDDRRRSKLGGDGGLEASSAAPSSCAGLALARTGTLYSVSLAARPVDLMTCTTASPADVRLHAAGVGDEPSSPASWAPFMGPSSSVAPAAGEDVLAVSDAGALGAATVVRVLPGHDASVAAAAGSEGGRAPTPAHAFSTVEGWRYFAQPAAGLRECDAGTEVTASALALARAAGLSLATACQLARRGLAEALVYPMPFWAFTSCRVASAVGAASARARPRHDLLGGSAGALAAVNIQTLLARTPWGYLAEGAPSVIGTSNATSWYAALGPASDSPLLALALADASFDPAASFAPAAWVSRGSATVSASALGFSASVLAAHSDAALRSLREACGYARDWQQQANGSSSLAAIAAALASNLTNASTALLAGLPHRTPTATQYLTWHAGLARARFNTTGVSPSSQFHALFNATFADTQQAPSHDAFFPCCFGGAGGGAVAITAGSDVQIGDHGVISVAGQPGGDAWGAGGSGGTIALRAGGIVSLLGRLLTSGGASGASDELGSTAAPARGFVSISAAAISLEHAVSQHFDASLEELAGFAVLAAAGDIAHDYSLVGPTSSPLVGLEPAPGRLFACNASCASGSDCWRFGPAAALLAVSASHVRGTSRAIRVRSWDSPQHWQRDGERPVHSGPAVVLAPRWNRLDARHTDSSADAVWSARHGAVGTGVAVRQAAAAVQAAALHAFVASVNSSGGVDQTSLLAHLTTAASASSRTLAEFQLRSALWSPTCVRSPQRSVGFSLPAGCPDVSTTTPRPDRITLHVRVEPPCHSGDGREACNVRAADTSGFDRQPPALEWGAHIALHDDSALPGYQAWALADAGSAWPPPALVPELAAQPWMPASNDSATRAPTLDELRGTLASLLGASAAPMPGLSSSPYASNTTVGLLELIDELAACDNSSALEWAVHADAMASAPVHCAKGSISGGLLGWHERVLAPWALGGGRSPAGSSPVSGASARHAGVGLTQALSAPHPVEWVGSLPPAARRALRRYYALLDEVRRALPPFSLAATPPPPVATFAALAASDVMAGVAAFGAGSSASLSWRHGTAYRSSVPPWSIPPAHVPTAGLDPTEQGGDALADVIRQLSGLACNSSSSGPATAPTASNSTTSNSAAAAAASSATASSRRGSGPWHKVDLFLDWEAATYRVRVDDVTVVTHAPLPGAGVTRIGLYAVGGATVFYDEVFAGRDDTLGFECPASLAPGRDLAMRRPSESHWGASDAGPDTGAWAVTRHASHLSRREMYEHSYHHGLVPFEGPAVTAFHSDVGPLSEVARSGASGVAVSGSGLAATGANNSVPDLRVVVADGGGGAPLAAPPSSSSSSSSPPHLAVVAAERAAWRRGSAPEHLRAARPAGVSAGALMWSPRDQRSYWYGAHEGARFNASAGGATEGARVNATPALADRAADLYYRRWYQAGGIGGCSAVGHGSGDGHALRLWRNEGLVLRFANLSVPPGMQPVAPQDPLTSERPEDAAGRVAGGSGSPAVGAPPAASPAAAAAAAAAAAGGGGDPLALRLHRPKALWNTASEWRRRACTARRWGVPPAPAAPNATPSTDCSSVHVRGLPEPGAEGPLSSSSSSSPGPYPVVMWAALDVAAPVPGAAYRAAGVAGALSARGPFTFLRGLRPSGNATVDLTLLQLATTPAPGIGGGGGGGGDGGDGDAATIAAAEAAAVAAPAFLARSYFASTRFLLPAPVMQPLWESVKESATTAGALALGPPPASGGSGATAAAYWYPATDFALNYHRAYYHAGYDDPDDTLQQRWRREDAAWNVSAGHWRETWLDAHAQFALAHAGTGRVLRYGPAERAGVLAATLDRHDYHHVLGQGRPPILSRFLDPQLPRHSAWAPSSVPAVKAQRWAASYRDKNIADNPPHPTVPDLLIGVPRVAHVRRASYVAVSALSDDYLTLRGEVVSERGGWAVAPTGGPAPAASTPVAAEEEEEIAMVVEGTLEGLAGDGASDGGGAGGGDSGGGGNDDAAAGAAGAPSFGQGWLVDLLHGWAVAALPADVAATAATAAAAAALPPAASVVPAAPTSAAPALTFGWPATSRGGAAPHAGAASTYPRDVHAGDALTPRLLGTQPDWRDRHWQYDAVEGDRQLDFRNFRDRQQSAACPNLHHTALLAYAACQALLDDPAVSGWADAPPQLDATPPAGRWRSFARGMDTGRYEACVAQAGAALRAYAVCVHAGQPAWGALPDWAVGARECVGGGGPCGPGEDTAVAGGGGGFPAFVDAAAAAGGTRSVARAPSTRDLVAEDRAQRGWPRG